MFSTCTVDFITSAVSITCTVDFITSTVSISCTVYCITSTVSITCTVDFITSTVSITRFDATSRSCYAFSSCNLPLLSETKSD